MPTPFDTPITPIQPPTKIDPKLALESLPGGPEDELDLDGFEGNLIKQTAIARDLGEDRAKAFFRAMINKESNGNETAVGVNPRQVKSQGRWQISDETARDKYKLDNTNPALNRYMGVDYWNEGYEKAREISDDPRVRAAIATAYYHHGPATISEMKRNGGVFPAAWDGGTTTNDHVYKVMEGWKKEIEDAGLNFDLTPAESETPPVPPTTGISLGKEEFSGSLATSKVPSNISGPKLDPRDPSAYLTFGVKLSDLEKVAYFRATPTEREEMQLEMIAKSQPGDAKKNLAALKRYRDYEPDAFSGLTEAAQIGVVDEVSVGAFLPRLMQAYNTGGGKGFDEELDKIKADIANFTLEAQGLQERTQKELTDLRASFQVPVELTEGVDPALWGTYGGLYEALMTTFGGAAGLTGVVAGKLGFDDLDRRLTQQSKWADEATKVVQEEMELTQKRYLIPGVAMSSARLVGSLPVVIGSALAGGPTGVYLQTLAQNAKEEPIKALMLASMNSAFLGAGMVEGATAREVAKIAARDTALNMFQMTPEFAKVAAVKLYAKQNPGKVSKKELEIADKEWTRLSDDFVANLIVGGVMGGLGALKKKGTKVELATGAAVNLGLDGSNQFSFFNPKISDPVAQGAQVSIAHVISPDLAPALVTPEGKGLGKIYLGAEKIPGEDYYLAKFTDKDGKILPGELISEEMKTLYDNKLTRIGKLAKEGASGEEIAQAIIEAQPTEIELGVSKVAALIEQETKVIEAESAQAKYEAEKGKFDENLAKFQAQKDALREQLVQFKKFADEPQVVTQMRKSLQESTTGQQMNMGANVIQQAIVTGYDTYRMIKDAGLGFAEWLKEMTGLVNAEAHPYLRDVWDKVQFLSESKTRGQVVKGEDGTWKFEGEPVKLFHATTGGFDEAGYTTAMAEWVSKTPIIPATEYKNGVYDPSPEFQALSDAWLNARPIEDTYRRGFDKFSIAQYGSATDIGWYGIGVYFGDLAEATKYAHGEGVNIRPNWVKIENPLVWDYGKVSSIPEYLRRWEIKNGKVFSPKESDSAAWDLPKEIHTEVENFVRDYWETKTAQQAKYQEARLAYSQKFDLIRDIDAKIKKLSIIKDDSVATMQIEQLTNLRETAVKELNAYQKEVEAGLDAGLDKLHMTEVDEHQLSRGITTIMKDKGYDGVFVIEENKDTPNSGKHSSGLKFREWVKQTTGKELDKLTYDETIKAEAEFAKGLAINYRTKEYVAFHPDQILSTLDGWTPRNAETGEKLSPTSPASKAKDALAKFISDEAGQIDLIAILDRASEGYDHLAKWGRNLDRFFVKRGKNLLASSNAVRDEYLAQHSERLIEIDKEITANTMAYPHAKGPGKTSLTAQLKRLSKEKVELTAEVAKLRATDYGNEATGSWLKAINASATAKGILLDFGRKATPLLEALGTTLNEYYKYRTQDRLEGARQRYLDWANSIDAMTEDDIIAAVVKFQGVDFYSAIKTMNEVAPGSFENAKTILHNLREATNSGDYSLVKAQLKNTFNLAAAMITTQVKPDYHQYRANNRLDQVNALYQTTIAEPLRIAFERTDSVPSGYLGGDNLYFPLMSEAPKKPNQVTKGTLGGLRPFKRAVMQKPKSPASHFTTGLSENYRTHVHDMQQIVTAQLRAGDRAGFIQKLIDLGIARPRAKTKDMNTGGWVDEPIPEGYSEIDAGPERVYSSKLTIGGVEQDKTFSPPAKKLLVPTELYKDIEPFISTIGVYAETDVNRLVGKLTGFAILGILEPVYHGWNVVDGLRAQLGWLPTDIWSTNNPHAQAIVGLVNKTLTGFAYAPTSAIGLALSATANSMRAIPVIRYAAPLVDLRGTAYTFGKMMSMNMFSKDAVKRDKMWRLYEWLLERGGVPERIGHTTYSPEIANMSAAHLVGPMQYKAVRKMYEKFTKRSVPDPDIEPGKFQEGSWWDEKFTGTKWEKPLVATKKFAQAFSMSPLVFGWNGMDMRARLAVAEAIQHYKPDATPSEVFEIVSLLGVYNRFAESKLGNVLKRTQIAPFYSASSARSRRVAQSWYKPTYGAKGKHITESAEFTWPQRIAAHFQESSLAYVAMWALTHHQLSGKWPWEDEEARLLKLKVSKDDITTNKVLAMMMPDGVKDGYIGYAPFFGGAGGTTMFGLDALTKVFFATNMDDRITTTEKLDLGARIGTGQVATSYAHVVGSGPLVHILPKLMFNVDPAISYLPSARGGGEYKLLQHNMKAYGASSWAKRIAGTLLETNAMIDNAAGFADMSPNEFESVDNPWNAEVGKFFFQLGSHNVIKSQENPAKTSALYRKSILHGRTKIVPRPGAYRANDDDDE